MQVDSVANAPDLRLAEASSKEKDAVQAMVAAMFAALKEAGAGQSSSDGSSAKAAGNAIAKEVQEAMAGGGILENQRLIGYAIAEAVREGGVSVHDARNAIGALGDLSKDGFTEVDAGTVQDLLKGNASEDEKHEGEALGQSESHREGGQDMEAGPVGGQEAQRGEPETPGPSEMPSAPVHARLDAASAGASSPDDILKAGRVGNFKTSDYGSELGNNKEAVMNALDKAGASQKEKALVLAMFMMETNSMSVDQRDKLKDGNTDGSKNISALNMNIAMVEKDPTRGNPGVSTYDPSINYNQQENAGRAAELCLQGIRERGANAWVSGHRGGAEAAKRVDETGTAIRPDVAGDKEYFGEFNNSLATAYQAIMDNPELLTNNERVETDSKPRYG